MPKYMNLKEFNFSSNLMLSSYLHFPVTSVNILLHNVDADTLPHLFSGLLAYVGHIHSFSNMG
jgi:hypothetical protein